MRAETPAETLRARTQAHYDKYPFRFDQQGILDEKMEHRLMGEAIRELGGPGVRILDVGCGACRVAHMVRAAGKGRVIGVDISAEALRAARAHDPGPVGNGDNTRLPLRSDVADLVISNGVIMITPDARAAFDELVRVTRPGGTLVVSVYDRRSWYYPVYRYGGAAVRALQRVIGDGGLRLTLFPPFHLGASLLVSAATRRWLWIPRANAWNLFHDQFTTPHCTFHTAEELREWARAAGMVCEAERREAANQLITLRLRKPERS
jgi:ubiquinone/menaquinone biosynthesis C-methylase UbiE